jgi:hypothetical protein
MWALTLIRSRAHFTTASHVPPLTAIKGQFQLHMSPPTKNGTMERTPFLRVSCESVSDVSVIDECVC